MRTFGSDPEVFAINHNMECIPPVILRKSGMETYGCSDEEERHPLFYTSKHIKIIEDGAAFEFNISPSTNAKDLYNKVTEGKGILKEMLKPYNLDLYARPVVRFNPDIIAINGIVDPYMNFCVRFGCDEDFDIYSKKYSVDIDASKVYERFAGGHLHIAPINIELSTELTKLLDILCGNTFIYNTPYPEEEKKRQLYYGRPGRIRLPRYKKNLQGLEWRTASISWLDNLESVKLMINATNMAMDMIEKSEKEVNNFIDTYLEESIQNILNFNQENSKNILHKVGLC